MDFLCIFLYIVAFLLTIISVAYIYFKHTYTYWVKKGVPTLKPAIPYGNARLLIEEKLNFGEHGALIYKEIKKQTNKFGGYFIATHPVLLPIDPELIKCILTKDFHIFHDRGLYCDENSDPLSANLINLSGTKWKNLRAKVSPTFTSGKMKMMFQTLLASSDELQEVLEEPSRKQEPVDIRDIIARLNTDNIGSCAFGLECNSLKNPEAEFRQYGKLVMATTFSDAKWNVFAANFPFVMKLLRIPITNRQVSKFFMGALKETVAYREENNIHRKDFLDLFIKLKNNESVDNEALTFNELAAQAYVFFIAGFETSGTAMSFCLLELSINEDIQIKLREEIFQVLKKHGGEITYEALTAMTYMDKVLYETLRKYPSVPMINRVCNEKYKIPGSDVTIDKKVRCWISVLGIHRDADYYPDPEKFDPERFSEEEKAKRHPYTYLPFGEGPRICIGLRFGLLQMKVCLTKLLMSYKFQLDEKTILPIGFDNKGITLAPNNTIWLRISKLNK